MQVVLVLFRSDGERRSFSVVRDVTVIGRREDCDLRIPLGDISRKHCRLIRDDDAVRIEDLGSSNGTFVNGQRVQEAVVQPGDTISVGPVNFVIQIDGVPADDELVPFTAPSAEDTAVAGQTAAGEQPVAYENAPTIDDGVVEVPPAEAPAEDGIELDELSDEAQAPEEVALEELAPEEEQPPEELVEAEAEPGAEVAADGTAAAVEPLAEDEPEPIETPGAAASATAEPSAEEAEQPTELSDDEFIVMDEAAGEEHGDELQIDFNADSKAER